MKQPTLDQFIAAYGTRKYQPNLYVREKGFKQLYVRVGPRWFGGQDGRFYDPTLDLASLEARYPGKGTFTCLIDRLRREYPKMTIFVESVLNRRFRDKLIALGFQPVGDEIQRSFVIFGD